MMMSHSSQPSLAISARLIGKKGAGRVAGLKGEYADSALAAPAWGIDECMALGILPVFGTILAARGKTTLVVCGVTTEVCVHTTVREANDRGYRCIVPADCTASYFPEFREVGLRMIAAQGGIFGWVSQSKLILSALQGM